MKKKIKITKEQILCVAAGVFLSLCILFTEGASALSSDENGNIGIIRPGAGEAAKEVELYFDYGAGEEALTVEVAPKLYTEDEAKEIFREVMDVLPNMILSENASLTKVQKDLEFPSSLSSFPGIAISYSPSDRALISSDGIVHNEDLTEPEPMEIEITLAAGEYRESFLLPLNLCPKEEESLSERELLLRLMEENDRKSSYEEFEPLPAEVGGRKVSYREKKDLTPLVGIVLGIFMAVLLSLRPKEEELRKKKERDTELLMDYSEVVSKLIVYIGAGLTIRNAWSQLSECAGESSHAVYEEVLITDQELRNGVPEGQAYMRFGKRCGLRCYLRLSTLLDQNRRTGDSALLSSLELEMEEAFEQRKNTAKRLGEEAGTKLMLPLMMSLITVLVIVLVPAVSKMM